MPLSLTGTLRDPLNNALSNARLMFAARTTSTDVLKGVSAETTTDASGNYSIGLAFGRYDLYVQRSGAPHSRVELARDVLITDTTTATSLNQLLVDWQGGQEVTPQIIIEMQTVAAQARGYRDDAQALYGDLTAIDEAVQLTYANRAIVATYEQQIRWNYDINAEQE